jgi:hypothetical protein
VTDNGLSQVLAEVVQPCSHCLLSFGVHESRLIGASVLNDGHRDRFNELIAAIKNHEWARIGTFRPGRGVSRMPKSTWLTFLITTNGAS